MALVIAFRTFQWTEPGNIYIDKHIFKDENDLMISYWYFQFKLSALGFLPNIFYFLSVFPFLYTKNPGF